MAQAQAAGVSKRQLRGSAWRRVGRATYVLAARAGDADPGVAALVPSLPEGAAFAGPTAARLHGFITDGSSIEVILPPGRSMWRRAGVVVRCVRLEPEDVTVLRGMPVTAPLRTCFDLASRLPLVEAVVATDVALHRRVVSRDDMTRYLADRAGLPGIRQSRRVLELAEPLAESPMETRLRLVLVLAGLPRPVAQVRLHDDAGRFLGRPDLYYPQVRLAIEYDGGTHRDSLIADNRRQNRLLQAGVKLLRYTAPDVYERHQSIVAEVAATLEPWTSTRPRSANFSPRWTP